MEHPVTAVYDANILYPAPLRDLFIRVAQTGLVRAKWTDTIHDEWIRNVLKHHPTLGWACLKRPRSLRDCTVRDCRLTGREALTASLTLPTLEETSLVPFETSWMFYAMSRVAALCCSTAAAMAVAISFI